jgi:hypothetical protein
MRRLMKHFIQKGLVNPACLKQCKITLLLNTDVIKGNKLAVFSCFHPVLMKTEFRMGAYIALLTPDKSSSTS